MFEFLVAPGGFIGALAGLLPAAALHWLFPDRDLALFQALLVVAGFVVGLVVEQTLSEPSQQNRP